MDFWETLFFHKGTPEYRKGVRDFALSRYLEQQNIFDNKEISETFFKTVDDKIKHSWSQGICPIERDIINYLYEYYQGKLTSHMIESLLSLIYDLYINELCPILVDFGKEFLEWCSQYFALYIISDTYTLVGKVLDKILLKYDLLKLFKFRFYSDQIAKQKPDISAIERILSIEKISSSQILHIGDRVDTDGELARVSGCNCIIVRTKIKDSINKFSGSTHMPIFYCSNLFEVKEIINADIK